MASDAFYGAVERFYRKLEGVRDILVDPRTTSIRLVMNAEKMVIAEAQRTYTYLALFGYRVDSVVVNRLIPDEINDPYFERWKELQAAHLEEINASFEPIPILRARLFDREMTGLGLLEELAQEVYRDLDPSEVLWDDDTIKVSRQPNGHTLKIRLPFTNKGDVDLSRKGDELHVRVGAAKRNVALPLALQREAVKGASFEDDWLSIRFETVEPPSQAVGTRS
jgi:arsenite-transporting ATPase